MKIKKLCKLSKKEIEINLKEIIKFVEKPKYICINCTRVSKSEEHLCSPKKL